MLDEHLPRSTKPGESDQENRPSRQNDRSSTDILARPGCTDLAEPGEHVESGGDTSLGTGAGDSNLVEDDSVYKETGLSAPFRGHIVKDENVQYQ